MGADFFLSGRAEKESREQLQQERDAARAEAHRLRAALETAEAQLDCWLDLPTGTRRRDLLSMIREALA